MRRVLDRPRRLLVFLWRAAVLLAVVPAAAQTLAPPATGQSLPDVLEAIQRARVTTRILYVTAHPDDESSSVLTYLARGLGADVALLSITRGDGGQNALGPEQGPPLGILRTEELLAATRTYGVRLYYTRAPDFGYSKTSQETLKVWGNVDVGHGHHQAAGILTPKASELAADPKAFPRQLDEGLKPWRTALLLQETRGGGAGGDSLPVDDVSPLWGKSYR